MDSEREGKGGKIWENGIETCKISCMQKYEGANEDENGERWMEVAEPGQGDCMAEGGQNCRQRGQMARAA